MIKKHRSHQQDRKYYRLNERISAPTLRVIDAEGKQVGVLTRDEALRQARDLRLDLVEIAAQAKPPVVKIIDFNKFLYQEEKKKREEKRKAKVSETKEIRLGPFMSDNDLQNMVKRCREFLEDGDKVKLVVRFKGRAITRSDFGREVIQKVIAAVNDISKLDRDIRLEGKQMIGVLSPERKKHGQDKNQEVSNKTV